MALASVVACLVTSACSQAADEIKLPCAASTNLSSYPTERELNFGASSTLRLKGIEMLALLDFDTTALTGRRVRSATLYLRYAHADRMLRTVGVSTVAAPWSAGDGAGQRKPGECCFAWRQLGSAQWAGADTDFTDVSCAAGQTIACYSDVHDAGDGWIALAIEPRIVQALVAGVSYGLAVSDEKGQTAANNDVYSAQQSGSQPYLIVDTLPDLAPTPAAVTSVTVTPDPAHADFQHGAARVTFVAPTGAFGYRVRYAAGGSRLLSAVGRDRIPLARPGTRQLILLSGLPPAAPVQVELQTIGAGGQAGALARAQGPASPAMPMPPTLPRPKRAQPTADGVLTPGTLRVWAYPETDKADPISGNLLEQVGPTAYGGPPAGQYRTSNAVWQRGAVTLEAARGEFVAFQLAVECAGANASVVLHPPPPFRRLDMPYPGASAGTPSKSLRTRAPRRMAGPRAAVSASPAALTPTCKLYRDWYVNDHGWMPEACIPITGPLQVPAADNAVPGQRSQSVYVELYVPHGAAPGSYLSELTVSSPGQGAIHVPVRLDVSGLDLPDELSFDINLNTYGTLGGLFGIDPTTASYRALERAYHRMAHVHRSTLMMLGYSHSGNVEANYAPPLEGSGASLHVSDWSGWDRQFGAYLDGSAFADLPRRGVPVRDIYLPFHEAWPVDIRQHYAYQPATRAYPQIIVDHALKAPPIDEAIDREFKAGFEAVAHQFAEHFHAKGWRRTRFQYFENDKYYYRDPKTSSGSGTSWWLLDEPNSRDDWLALAFFARLFLTGARGYPDVQIVSREDVSRPQWQRDYLDGLVGLMVVSGEYYQHPPLMRELRDRLGVRYWTYGAANPVGTSNVEAERWAVRTWLAGADGIVPWQCIGTDANYTTPDETALLLPGKRFGITGPIAALRLKALRRAEQDVEYLALLARRESWNREQVGAALSGILGLSAAWTSGTGAPPLDAGIAGPGAADFIAVREAITAFIARR